MSASTALSDVTRESVTTEVEAAVNHFDTTLGRPSFPSPCTPEALRAAQAMEALLHHVYEKEWLRSLQHCEAVTTTLPVLCASLREGSADRTPCPQLHHVLLSALAYVAPLCTYPIAGVLRDAEDLLPPDDLVRFRLCASAKALTPERMRSFLGLPPLATTPPTGSSSKGKGKPKKGGSGGCGGGTAAGGNRAANNATAGSPHAVSKPLLKLMLTTTMDDPCRAVLLTLFDNTAKFLALVGDDGDLAGCILDVYGSLLLPNLKPSFLLPCLDESLLDYFVDVVEQRGDRFSLLTEVTLLVTAANAWDVARLTRLCNAAEKRAVTTADAFGSLLVGVFLAIVLRRKQGELTTADAAEGEQGNEARVLAGLSLVAAIAAAKSALVLAQAVSGGVERDGSGALFVNVEEERWLFPLATLVRVLDETVLQRLSAVQRVWVAPATTATRVSDEEDPLAAEGAALGALLTELTKTVLLPSLRDKVASEPKAAASTARVAADAKKAKKPTGGKKEGGKGGDATGTVTGSTDHTSKSFAFSAYLLYSCQVLWLAEASMRHSPLSVSLVNALAEALCYCTKHQPQQLSGFVWSSLLDVVALVGWRQLAEHATVKENECSTFTSCVTDALIAATATSAYVYWAAPYILHLDEERNGDEWTAVWVRQWPQSLLQAIVEAAVLRRPRSEGGAAEDASGLSTALRTHLNPVPAAMVLGLLSAALSPAQLDALTLSLAANETTASAVLTCTERVITQDDSGAAAEDGFLPKVHELPPSVLAVAQYGARTLQLSMQSHLEQHTKAAAERQRELQALQQQHMQQKVELANRLAEEHQQFTAQQRAKEAVKQQETAAVREERLRRQAAKDQRAAEERAQREMKRQQALRTLAEMEAKTATVRAGEQRARFKAYKERLAGSFRVAVFLEHLELPPSRVMQVTQQLRAVVDHISPDELLEFLVTGTPRVPADMDVGDEDGDDKESAHEPHSEARAEQACSSTPGKEMEPSMAHSALDGGAGPVFTGHFWDDVLSDAPSSRATVAATRPTADVEGVRVMTDGMPVAPSASTASFHYRAKLLLDLFCYDGGDAFGTLPSPLPSLRIKLARRMLPQAKVQACGFSDIVDGFSRLRERGLVTIAGDVVRLTVLGFRYHFPFHEPDRMLEVRLQQSRERVRGALLALRRPTSDDRSESAGSDEEDEEEEEESVSEDRLLPELEFGI